MQVDIGDLHLFFDVDGAKLVPDGPRMHERPTLILLHGGPGFDHSHLKPAFSVLTEVAQLVYVDHRGQGRSDRSTSEQWHLTQWADDLHAFCQALHIDQPIVMGVSFGGFVAQAYAVRYPTQLSKLILASTTARMRLDRIVAAFERLGGQAARDVAARFWEHADDPDVLAPYLTTCFPLYNQTPQGTDMVTRAIMNPAVLSHFFGPGQEGWEFNFVPELERIRCPTLVLVGEEDPVTPPADAEDLVAALPKELVRFERFAGCGHGVERDDPAAACRVIREFVLA